MKERYPTFVDALRDLDDALSLLFLFGNLPSTSTVPQKTIELCQRLCHEFQHYLITTNSLRKSFLSIKGIYYQATIQGQDIMWLVPYRFVQKVTGDVDYRIMGTFVEFYTTLLGFVNFRLYTSIGLVYPPKFDAISDERGAELAAFTLEGRKVEDTTKAIQSAEQQTNGSDPKPIANSDEIQQKVDKLVEAADLDKEQSEQAPEVPEGDNDAIDTFEPAAPEADTLPQPQLSGNEAASLFAPFTFFISREAPRQPLEFLLRAFGCKRLGWDSVLGDGAFTNDESDGRITHQIVDRPPLPESALPAIPDAEDGEESSERPKPRGRIPGRTYIQPQWVWDCINEGKLLRPDIYAPGATLPPHLSPWMKPSQGAYDPKASLADQEIEGEAERAAEAEENESEDEENDEEMGDGSDQLVAADDSEDESVDDHGMDIAGTDDEEDSEEEVDGEADFGGFDPEVDEASGSEDEEETLRTQHQKELEAEAAGLPFSSANAVGSSSSKNLNPKAKKHASKKRKEEEELERQKMMMSRKKRKLLDKMLYSNKKKDEESEKLRQKRRKIEKAAKEA